MSGMFAVRRVSVGAELQRLDIPSPGTGELRIRVALVGICRTDVLAARGQIPCVPGVVLGHEFTGTVDAVGDDAPKSVLGRRVAVCPVLGCGYCESCSSGNEINCHRRGMLGLDRDGAFAEFICVPSSGVYPIPAGLSDQAAAYAEPVAAALAVLDALPTAGRGLVVGRNRFAELVVRILQCHGYTSVTRWTPPEPLPEEDSHDFAVETGIPSGVLQVMIRSARPGGTIILKSRVPGEVGVDVMSLVQKRLTLRGVNYGSFRRALGLLIEGSLDVSDLLGTTYPLEEFKQAFAADAAGEQAKLFLDPWVRHVRRRR